MPLLPDPAADLQPGRFGRASAEGLCVPEAVQLLCVRHSLSTAMDLVSFAMTFPDAVAQALGWTVADVHVAVAELSPADGSASPHGGIAAFGAEPPRGVVLGRTTAAELARSLRAERERHEEE